MLDVAVTNLRRFDTILFLEAILLLLPHSISVHSRRRLHWDSFLHFTCSDFSFLTAWRGVCVTCCHHCLPSSLDDDSYRTNCCSSEACLWNLNNQSGIPSLRVLHIFLVQTSDKRYTALSQIIVSRSLPHLNDEIPTRMCLKTKTRIAVTNRNTQTKTAPTAQTDAATICCRAKMARPKWHEPKWLAVLGIRDCGIIFLVDKEHPPMFLDSARNRIANIFGRCARCSNGTVLIRRLARNVVPRADVFFSTKHLLLNVHVPLSSS